MEKVRIYELAKDLNTTSKRLMEKLGEINIDVKNHMSFLEDHELESLYKHIGVVKHAEKKDAHDGLKHEASKQAVNPPPKQTMPKDTHESKEHKEQKDHKDHKDHKDPKKDHKSLPRIIRTTEIIVDSKPEVKDNREFKQSQPKPQQTYDNKRQDNRNDNRYNNNRSDSRNDHVRVVDSNSGLRAGFTRDIRQEMIKDFKAPRNMPKNDTVIEHKEVKPVVENTPVTKQEQVISEQVNNEAKASEVIEKRIEKAENMVDQPEAKQENKKDTAEERKNDSKKHELRDKPRTDRPQGDRQFSDKPRSDRPQGDRPQWQNRQQGDRPQGDRPQGDRPQWQNRQQGDRPQGDRPQGDRPQWQNRPQGDRPQGDRPQWQNRPQGDRPQGDRPQGDRPQGDRPQGDRPQWQNRPQGDRPQGDRPQWQNRPQGDRPQGDRPQWQNRPQGDRPQGDRPQGDRPQWQNRPQGDRPQGDRPQGDRPQWQNRQQGDRPQGDRPQWQNRPQGDRPQGDRPQWQNRPQGDRPQGGGYGQRSASRPLEIPKPDIAIIGNDEITSQRSEMRREFQSKDMDKDVKREQKRDTSKAVNTGSKDKKFKPQSIVLSQKKGVSEVLSEDFILQEFYGDDSGVKKTRKPSKLKKDRFEEHKHQPKREVLTHIVIPESLTVKDLAEAMKKTSTDIIKKLMTLGVMATINQEVDFDTAALIAEEFNLIVEKAVIVNEEDILFDDEEEDEANLKERPPVVVVMGHVDHGKTSLLDSIRKTNVIENEAGGITQHIGAYTVSINGRSITFLDTPGHEAFTAMRARGAQVTDIAILVVAADDGIMPQTIEAINHAKAANVSIIVAINKIDKPGANPDKVKQELTEYGLVAEEWGGETICVPVSAKQGTNIDHLLEMVLLTADILELKVNPDKQAKGTIIEAKLDKTRGPIATLLVQRGTLNVGDSIVTGTTVGRIRAMVDDKGKNIKQAGPSIPAEILGLPEVPQAGEIFYAITDEKVAKQLAEKRKFKLREQQMKQSSRVSLDDLFAQIKEGKVKDLNIIVKADVQGSVQAVKQSLEKLSTDEVRVKIIHGGVGAVTETDLKLAEVSNAIIIGFNVRPAANVAEIAQASKVDMRLYRIIYNAIEDVQAAMKGLLEPTYKEVILGHAEIRQVFKVSNVGTIGGAYVTDGKIVRNADIRVVRSGIVVHDGKLASLKRFKDDAKEVAQNYECGISVEKFNDLKEGDVIEAFEMQEVERQL